MRSIYWPRFPKLIQANAGKRIGLFIDGPKGMMGVKLCLKALRMTKDVVYCLFHDVSHSPFFSNGSKDSPPTGFRAHLEGSHLLFKALKGMSRAYLRPSEARKTRCPKRSMTSSTPGVAAWPSPVATAPGCSTRSSTARAPRWAWSRAPRWCPTACMAMTSEKRRARR